MYRHSGLPPFLCLLGLAALLVLQPGCRRRQPATPEQRAIQTEPPSIAPNSPATPVADTRAPSANSTPAPGTLSPAMQKAMDDTGTRPELAVADKEYEAWFKKYKLDLNDPAMLDADPDNDGFNNREEFLAGTNPLDPESRPGQLNTMKMKQYTKVEVPVILRSVEGGTAQVERTDEGSTATEKRLESVKAGQELKNSPYKVTQVRSQRAFDKDGHPIDASRVTLEDAQTKQKVELVKDLPARSSASYAVLTSADGSKTITVHQGDSFSWPDNPNVTYTVKDLREEQVILEQDDTKQMWTVRKQP